LAARRERESHDARQNGTSLLARVGATASTARLELRASAASSPRPRGRRPTCAEIDEGMEAQVLADRGAALEHGRAADLVGRSSFALSRDFPMPALADDADDAAPVRPRAPRRARGASLSSRSRPTIADRSVRSGNDARCMRTRVERTAWPATAPRCSSP
jgi:hypothetical protein